MGKWISHLMPIVNRLYGCGLSMFGPLPNHGVYLSSIYVSSKTSTLYVELSRGRVVLRHRAALYRA
jgi:hypothetical protein